MIILVAAMSQGRVIGKNGALPWGHGSMEHDQTRYRKMIDGKIIAIGSGTYDPGDDYIKNAKHVFLLTTREIEPTGHMTPVDSLEPILEAAKSDDIYVVGGAMVFQEFMPHADKLELTYIGADYEGDRYFPKFDASQWQTVREEDHEADENNIHPYKYVTLTKKAPQGSKA